MARPQYPINLIIEGRPCLVVGGGEVAARKVRELIRCGAVVTVVAPEICDELAAIAEEGGVTALRRAVEEGDLRDAHLVVAATDDLEVNRWVSERAECARALVNVVDQPDLCQFTAPAVVRRGRLTIAISTNGRAPALAKHLRRELSTTFGPEWEEVVEALNAYRSRLLERTGYTFEARRVLMDRACQLDLAGIARDEGRAGLEERLFALLDPVIES